MTRRARLGLLAAAVAVGVIGAAGWVSAQQGVPGPAPSPSPAETQPSAPVGLKGTLAPPAPEAEAPDAESDEVDSAEAAASAPERPAQPMTRPRYAIAVIQAMDKVTAETMRFEAPVGKPIRYKSLIFIVRACETTAPDETISDAAAHVEIDSEPVAFQGAVAAPARQVFRGWMFANSPGLNLFQNPAYDAWLIACKTASPAA
jgi:hypothetical protein